MRLMAKQAGFLLIAAVVLIVVGAVLAASIAFLAVSGGQSASIQLLAKQSLFVAEAGVEYATRRFATGTACTALGPDTQTFDRGTFTVAAPGPGFDPTLDFDNTTPLSAGKCRLRVFGQVDTAERIVETIVGPQNLLPTSANTNFDDPPTTPCNPPGCAPTNWTLSANPPVFTPWDDSGGPDGSRAAYAEKTSPGPSTATNAGNLTFSPAVTVTAPTSLQMSFDYLVVRSSPGGAGNELQLSFALSDGTTTWPGVPDPFNSGHTGTYQSGSVTFVITGTGTINITNLIFSMHLKSGQPKQAWADNLVLQPTGPLTYEIQAWHEVYP
jgi:hypothetical protein